MIFGPPPPPAICPGCDWAGPHYPMGALFSEWKCGKRTGTTFQCTKCSLRFVAGDGGTYALFGKKPVAEVDGIRVPEIQRAGSEQQQSHKGLRTYESDFVVLPKDA